jgi:phosphosulfolactate synthase
MDKGLTPDAVASLLETASAYVDIAKLGWGTACVTPTLARKLDVYRGFGVPVCCGGTLAEIAITQGRLDDYRRWLTGHRFTHVEISDGTIDLPRERKLEHIELLARDFVVLSEVGSKVAGAVVDPGAWRQEISEELAAGSWKVITEARESGTAGLFGTGGEVRSDVIEEVVEGLPIDRLLFEAPQKAQQAWFIRRFGPDVNLGNIEPGELIPLETLRLGLRSDTLLDLLPTTP